MNQDLFKQIPHVDKLMKNEFIVGCKTLYTHEIVVIVRDVLDEIRKNIKTGKIQTVPSENEIVNTVVNIVNHTNINIKKIINGTGVILHSNLGRACLSQNAALAAYDTARNYSTLEYDLVNGERGSRTKIVEEYLKDITGCKASLIVNNNAAAVLLILTTIASGGNVIVSRGELVEIGGGFRVPEIMSASGCELMAVGTTNKTRYKDYEKAINKNTKALLKVHTSNFKVVGFSETASISELSKLAKTKKIPLIEDIGSGALIDVSKYGINSEPTVAKSLKNGADIVCFSGDKLLGGPQCGIILSSKKYIDKMKSSPMYRALRVDKQTIAALEATLRVYADPKIAELEIPVLSMLAKTESELLDTAKKLQKKVNQKGANVEIVSCISTVGGGAVPGSELKSYAIAPVTNLSANKLDTKLRSLTIPIIGHIVNNKLLIDVRTLFERDYEYIVECITTESKI